VAKVTMPQLGESVAEGTIGKWLKKPGDHVAKYEPLLEVITDKVNAEVPSPFEGTLTEILVEEGATVPNQAEIAIIEEAEAGAVAAAPTESIAAEDAAESAHGPAGSDERPVDDAPARAAAPVDGASAAGDGSSAPVSERTAAMAEAPAAMAQGPAVSAAQAPAATAQGPAVSAAASVAATTGSSAAEAPGNPDARMTPAVRRLLREHALTAAQIVGTGGGGRITREDVINFVESQRTGQPVNGQSAGAGAAAAPSAPAPSATPSSAPGAAAAQGATAPPVPGPAPAPDYAPGEDEQLIPWTQMRKGVAAAMVRSKTTVPHAYTTVEVDVSGLVKLRDAAKAEYQARVGSSLSYVPFIVKAVVEALRKHPRINAHWTEAGLQVHRRINVGIAVAVDDGLIVPIVHDADRLSISGLNQAILDVAARARANRLRLDDIQGGTITVNNTGWFGSVASQSIVNTPQVAIVNMEAIVKRPVVLETPSGDVIAVRSMMNLPVAFDHRATDGAQIGRFVADIKAWLESIGPDTPVY
jgi:2-oxoisovalerate dehydrogenase E2 component (dihydrolipoyl transacylase)